MSPIENLALKPRTSSQGEMPDIIGQLQAYGVAYRKNWPWLGIGDTQKVQGWKLHLSSIPTEIEALFACVYPILKYFGVPFKTVQDIQTCALLNEGSLGATQIGKCMTIYAEEIRDVEALTQALVEATAAFSGPEIISDLYLGGRVFARYGAFNPISERDTLGQIHSYIYLPDGTKRPDGYGDPTEYLTFGNIPFDKQKFALSAPAIFPENHVLQEKYLIIDALDYRPRGATFQAVDVTDKENIRPKMVKQGRFHTLSDQYGRDIRDRFRHEMSMHQAVKNAGIMPSCEDYFEDGHSAYLVFDYVYGEPLENRISVIRQQQSWEALGKERQLQILDILESSAICIGKLHETGIVHRDISVSNLHIGEGDRVMLIDLELAQFAGEQEPSFGKGTPGFMSPEQERYAAPTFAQDIHGLGAVMLFSLTGIDPRRFRVQETMSHAELRGLFHGLPADFYDCLLSCFSTEPVLRPSITDLIEEIRNAKTHIAQPQETGRRFHPNLRERVREYWLEGMQGLENLCISRQPEGLWLSAPINRQNNRLASQVQPVEQRRSLNRGVAGVCYTLGVMGGIDPSLQQRFPLLFARGKQAAQWLLDGEPTQDIGMPGLHFGEAGVALALREINRAGILPITPADCSSVMNAAFSLTSQWPDVTHGAAGQGLTALAIFSGNTPDDIHLFAHDCATLLMNTQAENGSWVMPEGVPGMSGETISGFAHGVAGIGYFLTEYARRAGRKDAQAAAIRAAEWLESVAETRPDGKLAWHYSDRNHAIWQWWCHGAMGISTFFRALWRNTGDAHYLSLLDKSLYFPVKGLSATNLTLCHGMSGLGIHLLEAYVATKNERYLREAEEVIEQLLCRAIRTPEGTGWIVEDPHYFSADLLVGMGGVLLLLFYYTEALEKVQFPGNLPPI